VAIRFLKGGWFCEEIYRFFDDFSLAFGLWLQQKAC
jgi:hypothetical protein